MNTLIKQMSDFRNNFLMILAVFAVLHHRGIFWAWHQVWLGDRRLGNPWAVKDFLWDVYDTKILPVDSKSRALQVHVYWKSPKISPFVRATWSVPEQLPVLPVRFKDINRVPAQIEPW